MAVVVSKAAPKCSHSRRSRDGTPRLLIAGLQAQWPLLAAVLCYCVSISLILSYIPGARGLDIGLISLPSIGLALGVQLVALITLRFAHMVATSRPKHPIPALYRDVRDFLCSPSRLALGIPVIAALIAFADRFAAFKYNIPVMHPFSWDTTLTAWDRTLHFGRLPWEWLQPILGHGPITFALNVNYNLWFMAMWCLWVFFTFASRSSALRTRFLFSFVLIWAVIGGLAAVILSSAGPCYYGAIGHSPNPYQPLMTYLHAIDQTYPLWALRTQQMLLASYQGQGGIIAGISAMPSLHNATALLFALVGWKISRNSGIVLTGFAALIFLGSIHLGWHYAVDAYIGWAMVLPLWWLSGRIAQWNEARPSVQAFNALADHLSPPHPQRDPTAKAV